MTSKGDRKRFFSIPRTVCWPKLIFEKQKRTRLDLTENRSDRNARVENETCTRRRISKTILITALRFYSFYSSCNRCERSAGRIMIQRNDNKRVYEFRNRAYVGLEQWKTTVLFSFIIMWKRDRQKCTVDHKKQKVRTTTTTNFAWNTSRESERRATRPMNINKSWNERTRVPSSV